MTGIRIEDLKRKLEALRAEPEEDSIGSEIVKVLCDLAFALYRSDPEQAEDFATQALSFAEGIGFKKGIGESHMAIGTSHWARGDFGKALDCYNRSLRICEESRDRKSVASCYSNIGNIHRNQGDYERALASHLKALKIKEEITDKPGMAKSYNNIGIIYDEWRESDRALEFYFKALQLFEELDDEQGVALSYNNIGVVYDSKGDSSNALEYYHRSLAIKEKIKDKRGIAHSYINIGTLHEERDEFETALEYYLKALKIFKAIGDKRGIADSNSKIGRIYTSMENFESGIDHLKKGLKLARKIGAKGVEGDSYQYFSELYQAQGDFKQALSSYRKFSELRESTFNDKSAEKIARMQVRYETEKKEKEAQIYRDIFENTVIGMYRITPDGHILMANSALVSMLGYSSLDELAQRNILEVIFDSENPNFTLSEHFMGKEVVLGLESVWLKQDGASLCVRESSRAVRDESGNVLYYEGTVEDISIIRQVVEALRESEEKYRRVVENAGELIWQVDTEGKFLFFNRYAEQVSGQKSADWQGKHFAPLVHPDDLAHVMQLHEELMAGNEAEYTTRVINAEGRIVDLEVQAKPIYVEGKVTGSLNFGRNVTKRNRTEEELRKLQRLESIGTLAGGIAHDFNNILTGLFGNISLAKMKLPRDHPGLKSLEEAENSMNRAVLLTRQLLTFAKGGGPLRENISLGDLVREVTEFDLSGSNVMHVFKQADDLWMTKADKGQVQQVFSNLIINADQAMPDGGHLYITLENAEISKNEVPNINPGKYVKATVLDEGSGIDQKYLDRIFDPYFSTKQTGSGLGLAMVYSIINRHGGSICVDSKLGEGATFTLYLPASESRQPQIMRQPGAKPSTPERTARILVMDDEEIIRGISTEMLEKYGYTVDSAVDGKEAIEKYISAVKNGIPFDIVIMDLTIPGGMGGKEAVRKLLAIDPEAIIIVSSGYSMDPVMANYSEYGFKGRLAKPYKMNDLKDELIRVMKNRK